LPEKVFVFFAFFFFLISIWLLRTE
jgi:hypothetical protein